MPESNSRKKSRCSNCQKVIGTNARHCPYCGQSQRRLPAGWVAWSMVGVGLALFIGSAGILGWHGLFDAGPEGSSSPPTPTASTRAGEGAEARRTATAVAAQTRQAQETATTAALNEAAAAIDVTQTALAEATRGTEEAARVTQMAELEGTMVAVQATQTMQARPTPTAVPSPSPIPVLPSPTPRTFPAQDVTNVLNGAGGRYGALVFDLDSRQVMYDQNASQSFYAASLITLPIAMTAYGLAEQGALSMNDRVVMVSSQYLRATALLHAASLAILYL